MLICYTQVMTDSPEASIILPDQRSKVAGVPFRVEGSELPEKKQTARDFLLRQRNRVFSRRDKSELSDSEMSTKQNLERIIKKFIRASQEAGRSLRQVYFNLEAFGYTQFDKDFNLEEAIRQAPGDVIEVGGPTGHSWHKLDIKRSGREVRVSNIEPSDKLYGRIDFQADARKLPLRDDSLGVLFAANLPYDIAEGTIDEAMRVLKPGGLFIADGLKREAVEHAKKLGLLRKEQIEKFRMIDFRTHYDVVFQKKESIPESEDSVS